MVNVCAVVPDGVVLFLPSYAYEEEVCAFVLSFWGVSVSGWWFGGLTGLSLLAL